jgi:hypothetical protein
MSDAISAPLAPEGLRFSIGRAFSMTFGVLGRNFRAMALMLGAILPVVVYYLLRAEKEGIGIDDIVKVFD